MSASELSSGCLLVFARAPVAGATKTRLIPALGAEAAAQLSTRLLHRTLKTACDYPIELWCTPSADHPVFDECERSFRLERRVQQGGDLGARMAGALEDALRRASWALLIGTDCPELTAADLHQAASALQDGADAVLGPAADGGYYLIGLRRARTDLFLDMPWGTERVLRETRRRFHESGCRWFELPVRRDLDRPEDLAHFNYLFPPEGVTVC